MCTLFSYVFLRYLSYPLPLDYKYSYSLSGNQVIQVTIKGSLNQAGTYPIKKKIQSIPFYYALITFVE